MDVLALLQDILNRAKRIIEFAIKTSIDVDTETYFLPIQTDGQEVERINVRHLPASDAVITLINDVAGNVAVSRKYQFTSIGAQNTFNIPDPFNNADVFVDRVTQIQGVDYNISGQNIVFTSNQAADSRVDVRTYTSNNSSVTSKQAFTATANQTVFVSANAFNNVDVFVDRVPQIQGVDYNVSGQNITFVNGQFENSLVIIRTHGE